MLPAQTFEVASDGELVSRVLAGDREAFRHLFLRHRGSVASVCRQQLGSEGEVDDGVQETFARALSRLPQLRDPSTFGSWVRAIATRLCIDHNRVASRVTVVHGDLALEVEDAAPLPEDLAEAQERSASFRATLDALGARDRRALWLRHVSGASVADVAEQLGLTEGSARVMLTRARKRLRAVTGGVGVLVPLSWRQWLRNLIQTPNPALDLAAVAVAMTLAATAGAAISEPPAGPGRPDRDVLTIHDARPSRPAAQPASQRARPVHHQDRSTRPPARTPRVSGTSSPQVDRPPAAPVLRDVKAPVQVNRQYPEKNETDEIADVRIFSGEEEGNVRLYADDVLAAPSTATREAGGAIDGL